MSLIRSLCVSQILCFLSSFVCVSEGKDDDNLSVASVNDDYLYFDTDDLYFDTDDKESDLDKKKKNKYLQKKRNHSLEPKNLSNGNSKNNTKKYKILNKQKKQQISKKNKNIAKSEKVGVQASKLFYKINNNFLSSKISNFSDTRYLNVFAFNVGQANCIVLRCGDEVVIVDAGIPNKSKALGKHRNSIQNELEINILPQIGKVLKNTNIKAVFITHPHIDHYNLIGYLFQTYWPNQTESCRLFLGGTEQDWETIFSFSDKPTSKKQEKKQSTGKEKTCIKGILKDVTFKDVTYVTSAKDRQQKDIHDIRDIFSNHDIAFSFILPEKFVEKGRGKENGLSFLMKVKHTSDNCSFLFTGDAEGDNLQGAIGSANRKEILEALINELPKDKIKIAPNYDKLLQSSNSKSDIIANRTLFNNIGCVFVPHHGSRTEDSGRFISYLEDQPIPPATFIISSEVSSCQHNLPKRGAWESVSRRPIKHPAHFFTYHNGTSKKIKLTKKRVYITEAAPGGVYWLVSDGKTIWMYNAYKKEQNDENKEQNDENSDLGFFPITTISDNIMRDCEKINKQCNKNWKMSIFETKLPNNPNGETLRPACKGSDRLEKAYNDLKKSK